MAMFSKGIILLQHKEPAFSRPLVRFVNPQTEALSLDIPPQPDPMSLEIDALIEIAKAAQIVDERDGKLLHRKLLRAKNRAVAVVADAVDDEPYVSSKINPLLKLREEAVGGLRLCQKIAGTDNVSIMVYKHTGDLRARIPNTVEGCPVVKLRGGYPAQSIASQLKAGGGRKLIVGTGALIHFYRAVTASRRQSTVFLTVAGSCVANPMNLEVSLGMSVMQILERCGLSQEPTRVVCGGPMTGLAIIDAERTLITFTTRAILAIRDNKRDALYSCIGCGRCERHCPVGLNPMYLYRFVESRHYGSLRKFDAHLCTQCGICSYVCPSKLGVAATVATARQYALDHYISPEEEDQFEIEA